MKFFALFIILFFNGFTIARAGVACYNKNVINGGLTLSLYNDVPSISTRNHSCEVDQIPYSPTSDKYKGWIRVSPNQSCLGLEQELMKINGEPRPSKIHWISISQEVQKDQEGFVQLGYENQWDPGAGGTVKSYLKCYPIQKR